MFLSRGDRDLRVPTYFQQGSQALSCVEAWNSTFFLSCKRVIRPPVELRLGTRLFLEVQQGSQISLCVVRGYSWFHSIGARETVFMAS